MAVRKSLRSRLGNALAFVFAIGMGIIAGYVLSATEWAEEPMKDKRPHIQRPQ